MGLSPKEREPPVAIRRLARDPGVGGRFSCKNNYAMGEVSVFTWGQSSTRHTISLWCADDHTSTDPTTLRRETIPHGINGGEMVAVEKEKPLYALLANALLHGPPKAQLTERSSQ